MASLKSISNLVVTDRCNGRCNTCNVWRSTQHRDPTLEEINNFFTENGGFLKEVGFIQLTGGEPFLRYDLPNIVAIIQKTLPQCMIWIPTNGLQPEKTLKSVTQMLSQTDDPRLGVTVSIDGDEDYHDLQRGVRGSYKQALRTVDALRKSRSDNPGLSLSIGLTLTEGNILQAPTIQSLAYQRGVDFSMRPLNLSEHYYHNLGMSRKIDINKAKLAVKRVAEWVRKQGGLPRSLPTLAYLHGMIEFLEGRRDLPCSAASESVFIDSAGEVYPCLAMNQKLGNAYSDNLRDIMTSDEARDARTKIKKLECPKCWLECEVFRDIKIDKMRLVRAWLWSLKPFS
jgi:MoaA/NifB/PqqE/SkfB family radical SAM enzyme